MKRTGFLLLVILVNFACKPEETGPIPYPFDLPPEFGIVPAPEDNPITVEGVELGRMLFYDSRLSADSTQSCASCHNQSFGFSDNGERFSVGIDGLAGDMNAMTIINLAWDRHFFWNGRESTLEDQAIKPVINPIEMHEDWDNVVIKLNRDEIYPPKFEAAFGDPDITADRAVKAIAQFERTLISYNSKYDKQRRGEATYTASEQRGLELFFSENTECFHCHGTANFYDGAFHNNGLDATFEGSHQGRFLVTGKLSDMGKFKTTSLRNIALSAPYMHDGRFASLEEVIEHYGENIVDSPTLDPLLNKPGSDNSMNLTEQDKADLVAFLHTLTDMDFVQDQQFANPF